MRELLEGLGDELHGHRELGDKISLYFTFPSGTSLDAVELVPRLGGPLAIVGVPVELLVGEWPEREGELQLRGGVEVIGRPGSCRS